LAAKTETKKCHRGTLVTYLEMEDGRFAWKREEEALLIMTQRDEC